MSRAAKRSESTAWVTRRSSASQGAGRCTTSTATASTVPKNTAAPTVMREIEVVPIRA